MSDYEVSKSTQSTIFRDTLYFTCDLWLTKIDSKSILWLNIKESLICEYFSLLVQNLLRQIQNKRFFCFKVHPRIYSACLVLLSNLEKIKSLSLSLLESGESFKKFLFLLSNLEKWNPFHSSYHPRIYSACLVFQTQPAEQPALSWQRQSTPVPPLQMHLNNSTFSF